VGLFGKSVMAATVDFDFALTKYEVNEQPTEASQWTINC